MWLLPCASRCHRKHLAQHLSVIRRCYTESRRVISPCHTCAECKVVINSRIVATLTSKQQPFLISLLVLPHEHTSSSTICCRCCNDIQQPGTYETCHSSDSSPKCIYFICIYLFSQWIVKYVKIHFILFSQQGFLFRLFSLHHEKQMTTWKEMFL